MPNFTALLSTKSDKQERGQKKCSISIQFSFGTGKDASLAHVIDLNMNLFSIHPFRQFIDSLNIINDPGTKIKRGERERERERERETDRRTDRQMETHIYT